MTTYLVSTSDGETFLLSTKMTHNESFDALSKGLNNPSLTEVNMTGVPLGLHCLNHDTAHEVTTAGISAFQNAV